MTALDHDARGRSPFLAAGCASYRAVATMAALVALVLLVSPASLARAAEPKSLRFFISGHSLTDNPFGDYLAELARGHGYDVTWNQQIILGSPIIRRSLGDPAKGSIWSGYRSGKDRQGREGIDVLQELKEPAGGASYSTLILTESHKTAATLRWNDTVRYARHFHERFIDGNPNGTTFLFEPWESIKDKANLGPWVSLERKASRVWGCVSRRINMSLDREGRPDRIKPLPAASALVSLIEQATAGKIIELKRATTRETLDLILTDDVHLTKLGFYYIAAVTFVTVTGEDPREGWAPPDIPASLARSLRELAWRFHQERASFEQSPDLAACRAFMTSSFCPDWNAYVPGKWAPKVNDCGRFFGRDSASSGWFGRPPNPFAFDAATDATYWLPPPK